MKQSQFIQYAFAEDGDKTPVSIATDPTNKVSIQQGYTPPYEDDPSAGGDYIERETFNWIMNYFTKAIQAMQINGINELDQTILTSVGYPKGSRCSVWIDTQTCQLDRNGASNQLAITIPIVSMKDANKTDPYSSGALFGDWWIDDGMQIGQVKTFQVALAQAPSGYIDLAPNVATPSYAKADYPRIARILGTSSSTQWGYFKSTGTDTFTIINPRGYFPRVWSNGSSVDSGRDFLTLQSDAIRNVSWSYSQTLSQTIGGGTQRLQQTLPASTQSLSQTVGGGTQRLRQTIGGGTQRLQQTVGGGSQRLQQTLSGKFNGDSISGTLPSSWINTTANNLVNITFPQRQGSLYSADTISSSYGCFIFRRRKIQPSSGQYLYAPSFSSVSEGVGVELGFSATPSTQVTFNVDKTVNFPQDNIDFTVNFPQSSLDFLVQFPQNQINFTVNFPQRNVDLTVNFPQYTIRLTPSASWSMSGISMPTAGEIRPYNFNQKMYIKV